MWLGNVQTEGRRNSDFLREEVCEGLECFGIKLDPAKNKGMRGQEALLSVDGSKTLRIADLSTDTDTVTEARQAAKQVLSVDPDLSQPLKLDPAKNKGMRGQEALLSVDGSKTQVWVIPTNIALIHCTNNISSITGNTRDTQQTRFFVEDRIDFLVVQVFFLSNRIDECGVNADDRS